MPPVRSPFRPQRPALAELAAGAVIRRRRDGAILLLHQRRDDRWCLPKGHVEPGESLPAAALREAREETGLTGIRLGPERVAVHYRFYDVGRRRNSVKTVVYFDATSDGTGLRLESGFDRGEWVSPATALRRLPFDADREAVRGRPTARRRSRAGPGPTRAG